MYRKPVGFVKLATPSVHFYKSFQTTENRLLCMLSEMSSRTYKSEQREYYIRTEGVVYTMAGPMAGFPVIHVGSITMRAAPCRSCLYRVPQTAT